MFPKYIRNISTCSHIMQAGSHNEGIIGNVVSSLMQLAVMTSAGLENLKAKLSGMKISQNRQILCYHIQQFSSSSFESTAGSGLDSANNAQYTRLTLIYYSSICWQ